MNKAVSEQILDLQGAGMKPRITASAGDSGGGVKVTTKGGDGCSPIGSRSNIFVPLAFFWIDFGFGVGVGGW